MEPTFQYWIQEQAPAGNFYDSVGFSLETTLDGAKRQFKQWQQVHPQCILRLVIKLTIPIQTTKINEPQRI